MDIFNHQSTTRPPMTFLFKTEKDKLIHDLQAVIKDTEDLLRMTADHVGESADALRARVSARLNLAMNELHQLQNAAMDQAKAAGQATEDFVKVNPWKSVGIAAGVGLVVGLLVGRR
jgi:ElaB/YqjD/DUF883 family membrane-anchored ribosome-binding protein